MNIKITLDNPKYCDGCPFFDNGNVICNYYNKELKTEFIEEIYSNGTFIFNYEKRLKKCIKENGK